MLSVLYPTISPPTFTGPHIISTVCNETGNDAVDFTFECIVQYKSSSDSDTAMFDVALTFDGVVDESTIKTTSASEKTVVFTSADFPEGQLGKDVKPMTY